MSKRLLIDPPRGYLYGFPKVYDESKEQCTMYEWLAREGYPQSEIDSYGGQFYCWMSEVDEEGEPE